MERPFEEEEIRTSIWCMDKDKAPGPNGFPTDFFQGCWDVIKVDLMKVFEEFHRNGKIGANINSTSITLVPKKDRSVRVDYRPISLVTSLYKIFTKVLSIRLSVVFGETILENQSAFVAGRQILDATLIANEVVDDMRKWSKQCLAFKLDFEKAYDGVSWSLLDKVLERKGFGSRWRSWISVCLPTSTFSVIVNGEPKAWFHDERGVRQGDPLSPLLFTLMVDVLSRVISRAMASGLIKGVKVGSEGIVVSHLQLANDTILLLDNDKDSFVNALSIFQIFELSSKLKINLSKSSLAGINIDSQELSYTTSLVGCQILEWPLVYLSVPLGGNPRSVSFWDPVVEKISKCLGNWEKGLFFFRWSNHPYSGLPL